MNAATVIAGALIAWAFGFICAGLLLTAANDGHAVGDPVRVLMEPGIACEVTGHEVACRLVDR